MKRFVFGLFALALLAVPANADVLFLQSAPFVPLAPLALVNSCPLNYTAPLALVGGGYHAAAAIVVNPRPAAAIVVNNRPSVTIIRQGLFGRRTTIIQR